MELIIHIPDNEGIEEVYITAKDRCDNIIRQTMVDLSNKNKTIDAYFLIPNEFEDWDIMKGASK